MEAQSPTQIIYMQMLTAVTSDDNDDDVVVVCLYDGLYNQCVRTAISFSSMLKPGDGPMPSHMPIAAPLRG